jgi:hypothetical protein
LTYIAKQFMLAKVFFNKSLHILEDGANSVHVVILNTYLSSFFFSKFDEYKI